MKALIERLVAKVGIIGVEWRFVFKVVPVPILWTDRFMESWMGACSRGSFVCVRPKYRGKDEGIVQHELEHVRQFYRALTFPHTILYRFSPRYRLVCEIDAYVRQMEHYPDKRAAVKWMVDAIHSRYGLEDFFSKEKITDVLVGAAVEAGISFK